MEVIEEIVSQPEVVTPVETREVLAQEAVFFTNCVMVKLSGGLEKYISYRDFMAIVRNISDELENATLEGFSLPANTFYFAHGGDTINLSCYYASRVSPLKYNSSQMDIMMPNIIISHQLHRVTGKEEWVCRGTRYFSTDVSVGNLPKTFIFASSHSERVYGFPMSNTYSEGNMCYGGNQMPNKFLDRNLRGLDWYYQYLWESPFNDDLGIRACREVSPSAWYTLLKGVAAKNEPFPYNLLRGWTAKK